MQAPVCRPNVVKHESVSHHWLPTILVHGGFRWTPQNIAPTPHMQHVLLGKQSSLYYSKFPQIESDHNEANSTNDISAADLSTNMNSVSLTSAEIYIGDMFEWKGNVYEIKN